MDRRGRRSLQVSTDFIGIAAKLIKAFLVTFFSKKVTDKSKFEPKSKGELFQKLPFLYFVALLLSIVDLSELCNRALEILDRAVNHLGISHIDSRNQK